MAVWSYNFNEIRQNLENLQIYFIVKIDSSW